MLKGHLVEMRKAERAIARAYQVYAEQGHDELCEKTRQLWQHAKLARETVQMAFEAELLSA